MRSGISRMSLWSLPHSPARKHLHSGQRSPCMCVFVCVPTCVSTVVTPSAPTQFSVVLFPGLPQLQLLIACSSSVSDHKLDSSGWSLFASEEELHIASFPSSCVAPRARLGRGGGAENVTTISRLSSTYRCLTRLSLYPSSTVLLPPLDPKRLSAWSAL